MNDKSETQTLFGTIQGQPQISPITPLLEQYRMLVLELVAEARSTTTIIAHR